MLNFLVVSTEDCYKLKWNLLYVGRSWCDFAGTADVWRDERKTSRARNTAELTVTAKPHCLCCTNGPAARPACFRPTMYRQTVVVGDAARTGTEGGGDGTGNNRRSAPPQRGVPPLTSAGPPTPPPGPNRRVVGTAADIDDLGYRGVAAQKRAVHNLKDQKKAAATDLVFNSQVCKEALDSQIPKETKKTGK